MRLRQEQVVCLLMGSADGNGPLESMVVDAFTQIVFGSIGFHLKNDAYAQLVSVFQVFESVGVLAESGGYASITNSATNFGFEGLKAVGFSIMCCPSSRWSSIQYSKYYQNGHQHCS